MSDIRAWLREQDVGEYAEAFEAAHSAALTPLVSREEEIGLLLRRWNQAQDGERQVLLLSGEPGIGKSRITPIRRSIRSSSRSP